MKNIDLVIEVSLYLRGDNLDPNIVSKELGITPTSSHVKGEKRITSTKREYVAKIGVWALTVDSESRALSDHISLLASKIKVDGTLMRSIEGVQEAYIDIFIATDADEGGGGTFEFEMSQENISTLGRLNLPVRYEVTSVKKRVQWHKG